MTRRLLLSIVVLAGVSCTERQVDRDHPLFSYLGSSGERQFWLGAGVEDIAAGPGDEWVVSAGGDGRLQVWDVASGKKIRSIDAHDEIALCVDVTEDGKTIVSGGGYGWLCIWDTESGVLVHKAGGVEPPHQEFIRLLGRGMGDVAIWCLSVAPGGKRVALGRGNGAVELWDLQTGKFLQKLEGHGGDVAYVGAVSWSPTGKWFATGGADEYLRIWDAATGELIRELKGPAQRSGDSDMVDSIRALDVSADGSRILSAGKGDSVQLWEVDTGKLVRTYPAHSWNVLAAAFAADGKRVVSGSVDGDWCVWDPRTGQRIQPEPAPWPGRSPITAILAGRDGRWLATGGGDGSIKLWDAGTGEELRKPSGHTDQVTCLVADPRGAWIASGSADTTVRLWDARSGTARQILRNHQRMTTALAVTPDGRRLVSGSSDKRVTVWDLANGKVERTWRAHGGGLNALAITRDGRRLISGGADGPPTEAGSVKTWDLASGNVVQTIDDFSGSVNHVFMDPSEQRLVTESSLGVHVSEWGTAEEGPCQIRVWDTKSGERVGAIAEIEGGVLSTALSPSGAVLATAGLDRTVTLWDVGRGAAIRKLSGAEGRVTAIAFSRDGHWVLGCGTDDRFVKGHLRVWEVTSGARLGSVEVEVAPTCMLVHASVVWLGMADGTIRRYRLRRR